MAIKKYLSLEGLSEYDALIKGKIDNAVSNKANSSHTHTIANITNLQTTLDNINAEVDGSIKALSVSGKTITYTKNDGSTGTITTQDTDNDTKVTNTLATTTKAYVTGTTSATTNTGTQVFDTGVYLDTTAGQLTATTFKGDLSGNASTATSATKATQDGNGNTITSTYETKSDASAKLTEAKTYADSAAAQVKNDLLNGAGGAYDTLKELGDLIDVNVNAIEALETVAANKADKTHTHAISDVTNLQSALDGKAASSHGTHVSYSTTAPVMDGTASVGSASTVARSDHKHPTDTSRASKTEFDTHTANTTNHITSTERTNWGTAYTHSQSAHAPSNAQPNQNAFSNITVGSTTVSADTTTDTVTFVGSNVTITPDATNDKITFTVADGSTSAKGLLQLTNSTSSTSTTTAATPNSVKSAYDLANQAKTAAATAQTTADSKANASHTHTVANITDLTATAIELNYMDGVTSNVQTQLDGKASTSHPHSDASTSASGFMTAAMVTKLNGIATGATKVTVDTSLSTSSANPVQNKIVATAFNNVTSAISTNTNSITAHSTAIGNLQTAVAEIQDITSAEIQALFSTT